LVVHGWVYGLQDGLLKDMSLTATAASEVEAAYDHALERLTNRWLERQAAG
jgi:carbonic anhydrase